MCVRIQGPAARALFPVFPKREGKKTLLFLQTEWSLLILLMLLLILRLAFDLEKWDQSSVQPGLPEATRNEYTGFSGQFLRSRRNFYR